MVAPAAAVAVSHVTPLSSDTFTTSPAPSGPLRVPEMVWAAMLVTKSVALAPVSAEKATVLTTSVDVREQQDRDIVLAEPGQPEVQLISHEADDRRPGDDGDTRSRARSTMTSPSPTMEKLRLRPSPVTDSRSPRIGSEAMCVTSSCVVPRLIVNVPPFRRQEQLLRVVGVPVRDVLDDVRAAIDDIERHLADVGRRRRPA